MKMKYVILFTHLWLLYICSNSASVNRGIGQVPCIDVFSVCSPLRGHLIDLVMCYPPVPSCCLRINSSVLYLDVTSTPEVTKLKFAGEVKLKIVYVHSNTHGQVICRSVGRDIRISTGPKERDLVCETRGVVESDQEISTPYSGNSVQDYQNYTKYEDILSVIFDKLDQLVSLEDAREEAKRIMKSTSQDIEEILFQLKAVRRSFNAP